MVVSIDTNSGFCFGVTRAIKAAESELNNGPLCCLGDIVHNGQEVARLEDLGLRTIDYDELRTLPAHSRVLLRAHGEPPSTYWIAQQRGIEIIDATCPVVKKLQDRIRACYETHRNDEPQPPQIVIYGKPGHAEVIGLQGQTNNTAIVIESIDQLDRLDFNRPIYLFSQTTKSVEGFHALVEAIKSAISNHKSSIVPEVHDTICRNVANRVAQLQDFARANDIVFFVGGTKSSNARVLFNHCLEANPNTFFISSPAEIPNHKSEILNLKSKIINHKSNSDLKIGICGATSTPLWLMEQVKTQIEKLEEL